MSDYSAPQPAATLSPSDDRLWASLSHFLNVVLLVPALIIYLVFKDRGPRVKAESTESLNFTINVTGALLALYLATALFSVVPVIGVVFALVFGFASLVVIVLNVILAVVGGIRVSRGGSQRYPLNIRWIK